MRGANDTMLENKRNAKSDRRKMNEEY